MLRVAGDDKPAEVVRSRFMKLNADHARNKNVLVVGGSGSGKTRFFIKPNLLQCDSKAFPVSFVVTDPNG